MSTRRARALWPTLRAIVLAWPCAVLAGCVSSGSSPTLQPSAEILRAREPRIDAIVGRELVVPVGVVQASGRVAWTLGGSAPVEIDPREPLRAKLDDGREVRATLWYLSATAPASDAAPPGIDERWMAEGRDAEAGRRLTWSASRATSSDAPPRDAVVLLRAALPDEGLGLGLWINGRRHDVQWLMPLAEDDEAARSVLRPTAPAPALGDSLAGEGLRRIAAREESHPTRRWRARLALRGLRAAEPPETTFADPVVEALAAYHDERWRVAFVRLWNADPELAERLRLALAGVIDFGEDPRLAGPAYRWMPAWAPEDALLEDLRESLLSRDAAPDDLRRAAERYLDRRPALAAALLDQGGLSDAESRVPIITAAVVNLSPQRSLAWLAPGESRPRELAPIESMAAARISWWPDEARPEAGTVSVRIGARERELAIGPMRREVRPPGLTLGPLEPERTMRSFLGDLSAGDLRSGDQGAGSRALGADASGVRAVLQRDRTGWFVVARCATDAAPGPGEEIRLWIGTSGRGARPISASPAMRAPAGQDSGESVRVRVLRGEWSASIRIPPGAVEPDGTLRLGLERIDARGRRWSWPSAMFPWQTDPGRAAIDLRSWGGLTP